MSKQPTVLIIDDNDYNLHMAKDLLLMAGFHTLQAREVETGVNMVKSHLPDLVLMDMYMPVKDGFQATRELKADPETQDVPVIAFTALASREDQRRAEAVGCSGVISKPIDVDSFAQTVGSYLGETDRPKQPHIGPMVSISEHQVDRLKLSHDLQGPIRKIQLCCRQMVEMGEITGNSDFAHYLDIILRSTDQLLDTVNAHVDGLAD